MTLAVPRAVYDELRPALHLPAVVNRVAGKRLHARAVDGAAVPGVPQRDVRVGADGDRALYAGLGRCCW